MAKEVLVVPEDKLLEVIAVVRAGLEVAQVSEETREHLAMWCDDEEAYITGCVPNSE